MKKVVAIVALIVAFGFVSCTENTETIEQQNEKFEILGSDKNDDTSPNSGGGDNPDNGEG